MRKALVAVSLGITAMFYPLETTRMWTEKEIKQAIEQSMASLGLGQRILEQNVVVTHSDNNSAAIAFDVKLYAPSPKHKVYKVSMILSIKEMDP